ncbi:hypothetical protein ARMSODRAFT_1019897 [Armillaria solidipes]|uniref:FAD/NAD(P)-binding domain-containing protein n=1 Tax=Armillaria solidipes TaxID=1076256 RepID=A0A2H3BQJ8_9AGAR|nr:hypothetical protein ARMSODRAFT_1019897 [Armillaria solidipes]
MDAHLKKLEESQQIKATWWTEEFNAVVVAAGPYDQPHVLDVDGLIEWSKVRAVNDPSVYHLRAYHTPQRYTGKNVLVVGVGSPKLREYPP